MRVFAYCIPRAAESVRAATGVTPYTSLPWTSAALGRLPGADLLYFRLHGAEALRGIWFGEDGDGGMIPALEAHNIRGADLRGAVAVVANCYGANDPLVQLLYQVGARAVIAGEGPNMAAGNNIIGTDLLVRWFRLSMHLGPAWALRIARARLLATGWRVADRDALAFRIIDNNGGLT
jgi:hypothetical protein